MKLTHGSLFSGIEGFGLGAQMAGIKTIWSCEAKSFKRQIIHQHFPDTKQYEDIKTLTKPEPVDIISGGFPCKQTSVGAAIHGKRLGLDGIDSGLWFEQIRVLTEMRPTWCIIENPSAVKEWEAKIKGSLEDIGYTVSRLERQASDYGLPHKRRRYLYVGNTNGQRLEVARRKESPSLEWLARLAATGGAWLTGTPGITGGFNGLSNRVERVKALGDAVSPFKAYEIFKAIVHLEANINPATQIEAAPNDREV